MRIIILTVFLMLVAMFKFSVLGFADAQKAVASSITSPMLATDKWLLNVNKRAGQNAS